MDLISRQAALKICRRYWHPKFNPIMEEIEKLPPVQPEPCEYAVSATAVEEMLNDLLPKRGMWEIEGDEAKTAVCETVHDALEGLWRLPFVKPEKAQLSKEDATSDCISRQEAIALGDNLKDDLPDDEQIAGAVMAHNEGILEYQTAISLLPSAQPEIIRCKDCKHYDPNDHCFLQGAGPEDYCSCAERREE